MLPSPEDGLEPTAGGRLAIIWELTREQRGHGHRKGCPEQPLQLMLPLSLRHSLPLLWGYFKMLWHLGDLLCSLWLVESLSHSDLD